MTAEQDQQLVEHSPNPLCNWQETNYTANFRTTSYSN